MPHAVVGLLKAFALMLEPEVARMGDAAAAKLLLTLLERQGPFVFLTKDGPATYALLTWFGLIPPHRGQDRLDALDPELVWRVLVAFARWKAQIIELDGAQDAFGSWQT